MIIQFIRQDGNPVGEWPLEKAKELIKSGRIKPTDYYCHDGMDHWAPVAEYDLGEPQVLSKVVAPPPPEGAPIAEKIVELAEVTRAKELVPSRERAAHLRKKQHAGAVAAAIIVGFVGLLAWQAGLFDALTYGSSLDGLYKYNGRDPFGNAQPTENETFEFKKDGTVIWTAPDRDNPMSNWYYIPRVRTGIYSVNRNTISLKFTNGAAFTVARAGAAIVYQDQRYEKQSGNETAQANP